VLWTIFFCLFLVGSRLLTVFPPLYLMRQGYRVSLLPAINLCQMSELSLVLLALGNKNGDVSDNIIGIAAFSFALLAVDSTYAIFKSEFILEKTIPWLNKIGFHDLDRVTPADSGGDKPKRIGLLGFSWTASSLLEEISRERSDLLDQIIIVDFNPNVYEKLRRRGVRVVYGDITRRDVLHHSGVAECEIIICSLPNMVLKGADNLKLLRQLRELNPAAKIIVHAELLSDIPGLYHAGAGFVTAPRLLEAADLLRAIEAAEKDLLDEKRGEQLKRLEGRSEVIP
jgi:hypothetical protein